MSIHDRRRLPSGRNFDLAEGLDCILEVSAQDNAGAVLDLTNATSVSWKMQPSVTDSTGAIEKTLASGVTIKAPATAGILEIAIAGGDSSGKPGSAKKVTWYHRCQVTIGGKTYMLFTGNVKIWKVG